MKKNVYFTSLRLKDNNLKNCFFSGVWSLNKNEVFDKKKNKKIINPYLVNTNNLSKVYFFLEKFYYREIHKITRNLNKIHKTNFSYKYWAILLFPWLQNYIAVLYDRWKILSDLEKKNINFIKIKLTKKIKPIKNSNDFYALSQSTYFNQYLFEDILDFKKNSKQKNFYSLIKKKKFYFNHLLFVSIGKNVLSLDKFKICNFYLDVNFNKKKILFFEIFRKLYIKIITKVNNILYHKYEYDLNLRLKISNDILGNIQSKKKDFQNYFYSRFFLDIPSELIEGYKIHSDLGIKFIRSKNTYSMYSHFNDFSHKLYLAERKISKDQIISLEHGGSFPHYRMNFNFEENFFDKKFTWYKKHFNNHKQYRNIDLFKRCSKDFNLGNKIIILGTETSKYLTKIIFSSTSSNIYSKMNMIESLYKSIKKDLKKNVFFKPHPSNDLDYHINTLPEYKRIFGKENLLYENIMNSINKAKILICTSPETTFTECILSNKPTILIYDKAIYKRHNICKKLIYEMKKNKIIFFNSKEASQHLNRIYKDPFKWYNSKNVKNLRKKFLRDAVNFY